MKKIAIIADSLSGGGIERVVTSLVNYFISKKLEVHLILLRNDVFYDLDKRIKLHVLSEDGKITKNSLLRPYIFANKLKKIVDKENFDLILSNLADFSGIKIVRLSCKKNLYTIVHNTQSRRRFKRHPKETIWKKIKKYRVKKSFENTNLICVSEGVEKDLLEVIKAKPKSVRTIYNPFDLEEIRRLSGTQNSQIPNDEFIIHVGRFELIHKRQDVLLKAYKKANVNEKLVLLGDGKDRNKIEKLIDELELQDKVILAGFDTNPYSWMKKAKLFVFASDYEGFGNVLVESLIVDTPVVSTNCKSGPSEILTGELAEYLVSTGDEEALATKICEALEYYPKITNQHIEKFSIDAIGKQYLELM